MCELQSVRRRSIILTKYFILLIRSETDNIFNLKINGFYFSIIRRILRKLYNINKRWAKKNEALRNKLLFRMRRIIKLCLGGLVQCFIVILCSLRAHHLKMRRGYVRRL